MRLSTNAAEDTHALGRALATCLADGDVVCLNGTLGAGKTQLAQGVGEGLGFQQKMPSPTFNIVFEYDTPKLKLYHFDLYRLEDESQLEDIDFYELSDTTTPGASLIEWADMFPDEMPEDRLDVHISILESGERELELEPHGARAEELAGEWVATSGKIL